MLCSSLYSFCISLRLLVSVIATSIDLVIVSPYIITWPFEFLAALPIVCIREVSERRKPSLSASKIAIKETSGKSNPSLKRLIPTSTSYFPSLKSLIISILSIVSISECKYVTFISKSSRYRVKSSLIFLVRVVIRTRSPFSIVLLISLTKSSICPFVGRTSIFGSNNPVGLIICSTTSLVFAFSYFPGVADT